ncbi:MULTISPECIES: TrkH family potassium uptake protein [Lacrimispora]|jgi:trk system potassium uptake protein TrkH|uniref:TrkH family potassium uptake protein n=1 Tax=Lacrimispora TaxID=2719231 RepID=UPI0008C06450|nr:MULTISPECIES: TrkH family potassium uptake protein [Lacrimispora]MDR7814058.1 TrkH family potassium uptake protein [Lacrimispora sp.]SEU29820.1 trk system potassium uptake protein TrkH [Lacrimispora sphenoides]
MNKKVIIYLMGWILNIEAVFMLLPCVTALIYRETSGYWFLAVMAVCGGIGIILTRKKPENMVFFAKEGFVSVALSWIVLSFFGAMPFYLSGEIPRFEDAMFEVISGFTTTGSSILTDVESLSQCMIMWRSFTHWIGGMGVLVFILSLLPLSGGYNMYIMKAESPGPSVGKLVPRVRSTAKILYTIYLFMTVLQIILLLIGGMPLFDSLAISFGTAGTGGFGIKNSSMAFYDSYYLQGVVTVFMILFGINFNVYHLLLTRHPKEAFRCEEARAYLGIIAASVLFITFNIRGSFGSLFSAFHHAAFQVASIITTTGYSTVDFDLWPEFSKGILVALMFIGACAGSTGGGFKVSRVVILLKAVKKELGSLIHPRSVKVLKLDGKPIEHNVLRSINTFLCAYIVIFTFSVLIVSLDNFDFATNFTAVAATFNNIGPGLAGAGPLQNFSKFSALSKYVMMFDMLAGRLEVFPLLLIFAPSTWKNS